MKPCTRCGETKPFGSFHRRAKSNDGLQPLCKDCARQKGAAQHAANRERRLEQARLRHATNPEPIRARALAWQRENRERHNANSRKSYYANLEVNRARSRENARRHRAKYPEKVLARNAARFMDAESMDYVTILRGDPCCYCGGPMEHVDHIDPVASGGANHWSNLTAACRECNQSKSGRSLLAYLATAA